MENLTAGFGLQPLGVCPLNPLVSRGTLLAGWSCSAANAQSSNSFPTGVPVDGLHSLSSSDNYGNHGKFLILYWLKETITKYLCKQKNCLILRFFFLLFAFWCFPLCCVTGSRCRWWLWPNPACEPSCLLPVQSLPLACCAIIGNSNNKNAVRASYNLAVKLKFTILSDKLLCCANWHTTYHSELQVLKFKNTRQCQTNTITIFTMDSLDIF